MDPYAELNKIFNQIGIVKNELKQLPSLPKEIEGLIETVEKLNSELTKLKFQNHLNGNQ